MKKNSTDLLVLFRIESIKLHGIRLLLIVFLSLVIVHLLSQQTLPFTSGYAFPWTAFGLITLFGLTLCNLNWIVYYFVSLPKQGSYKRQLINRLAVQAVSTIVFYSILYTLVLMIWFSETFVLVHFLKYLLICFTIIVLEFLVFELWQQTKKEEETTIRPKSIVIKGLNKDVNIPYTTIEMFSSSQGVITMYSETEKPVITRYSSLDELERELPSNLFFRVNRQFLVNRDVIHQISRKVNRTLHLDLKLNSLQLDEPLVISRYKKKEFLTWLKQKD